jgi:hypothetical protein
MSTAERSKRHYSQPSPTRRNARAAEPQIGLVSPPLFSLHINNIRAGSRLTERGQQSRSRVPQSTAFQLSIYLSHYPTPLPTALTECPQRPEDTAVFRYDWETHQKPRPAHFLGQPMQRLGTPRYLWASPSYTAHVIDTRQPGNKKRQLKARNSP